MTDLYKNLAPCETGEYDVIRMIERNTRGGSGNGGGYISVTDGNVDVQLRTIRVSGDSVTVLPTGELQIEIPDVMPQVKTMMPDTMVAWSGYESNVLSGVNRLPYQYVICDNWNTVDAHGGYISHTDEQLDVTVMVHVTGGKSKGGTLKVAILSDDKEEKSLTVNMPAIGQTIPAYRVQMRGLAKQGVTYYATYEFSNPPAGFIAPYRSFISVDAIGKSGAYRSAIGLFENANVIPLGGTEVVTTRDASTNALRVKAREVNKDIVNVTE